MKKLITSKKTVIFLVIVILLSGNIETLYAQKISQQPASVEFCLPDIRASVSFSVVASPVTSYQWQGYDIKLGWIDLTDQKGVIGGSKTATLTVYKPISGWSTNNSAKCRVKITYLFNIIYSKEAELIINSPATITADPVNDTIWIGETATFSASSSGKPTPAKQWQKYSKIGWSDILGATSSTYTTGSAGSYRLKVTNVCATDYSSPALLVVVGITSHPSNITVCVGYNSPVSFTVGASGATAYQWAYWVPDKFIKGAGYWQAIKGATSSTYTINPPVGGFTTSYNKQYRCAVTFQIGVQYSNGAYFTVNTKPSITQHPISQSKNEGESVTFNVSASSTLTKTYQWYKNDNPIGGATSSSLTLNNLQVSDAGGYKCMVSNDCGSSTSNTATLTVVTLDWPQGWFSQRENTFPENSKYMYDVHAIDENTAWAVVSGYYDSLLYTTNGGETWNWTHSGVAHKYYWQSVFFTDANHGWISGNDVIAYTVNGGTAWNEWYDAGADVLNDLYFINSTTGWAVGNNGIIYKTVDGGVNWNPQSSGKTANFSQVFFADANNGIVVGAGGNILYTHNGGTNWYTPTTNPSESSMNAVYMIDKDTAFIAGSYQSGSGYMHLKTTDGGENWTQISGPYITGYDLHFVNDDEGWMSCSSGKIFYTNNGGQNWYEQKTETSKTLYAISMVDSDNGWTVGADGAMLRTAFGGCWLPRVSLYEDQELCASLNYRLRADTFGVTYPTYLWSTGQTSGNIYVTTTDKYYVDVWNMCGDKASDTINVRFFDLPNADAGEDTAICYGDTIQINASGGILYSWNYPLYLSDPDIQNPLASPPVGNTNFTVSVTDTNGCINTDAVLITVYQVPTSTFTLLESVCEGLEAMASYTGNATLGANYAWNFDEGAITPLGDENYNVSWDTTGERTVTLAVDENGCHSDTTRMTIIVNAIPVSDFSIQAAVCGSDTIGINYEGVGSINANYEWDFDDANLISGENEGPYQVSWATEGTKTLSLQVTQDGCVSELTEKDIIVYYPFEGEEICLVTVDEETGKNAIIWEKTPDPGIASYNVYRESTTSDVYDLLANISYDNLSVYVDITSQPEIKSYKYRISVVDTCGNESSPSKYHKTMLLTSNLGPNAINLSWTEYVVEGGGFGFVKYLMYRGDAPNNLAIIDSIASDNTLYPDYNPPDDTMFYRIAGVKATACYPSVNDGKKAGSGPYSHSLSNLEDNRLQTSGVKDLLSSKYHLNVYPNPFRQETRISYSLNETANVKIEIFNLLGVRVADIVNEIQSPGEFTYDLTAADIGSTEGIFYIRFTVNGQNMVRKLIMAR